VRIAILPKLTAIQASAIWASLDRVHIDQATRTCPFFLLIAYYLPRFNKIGQKPFVPKDALDVTPVFRLLLQHLP
jgi:hypothetical protein